MIDDDELRERLRASGEVAPTIPPPIERIARRARWLRYRRWSAGIVTAAIAAAGVAIPVAVLAPVHGNAPSTSFGSVPDSYGIHLDVPDGWDERMSYTSTDLGKKGRDDYYGVGRVDAGRALTAR